VTIAITAATGQLGGFVLDELLTTEPAESLVAIVRDPARAGHLRDKGISVRAGHYDDKAGYVEVLAGVDKLLLVSGLDFGRRVQQHTNVIEAASQAGVSLLAYPSAPHANTSALPIAAEHKATEKVLTSSGIPYVILRNNWYTEMFAPAVNLGRRTGAVEQRPYWPDRLGRPDRLRNGSGESPRR
jgi:NAD(P)H dehydrogenase (quinone)